MIREIKKLSPSAINKWYTCPFQYYCHYLDKREQIKTPDTTSFGIAIHNIIDHYYDNITLDTTIDEVPYLIEKAYTELGNWATQKRKSSTRKTQQSLLRFERKRIKRKMGIPTVREELMTAKLSDKLPLIYGKPDMYFEKSGLIIDWKTGKWAELNDALKIQGKIYELILEANGYKPKKIVFDYVVLGKRIPLPPVSTSWVEGKIEDMMIQIKKEKFTKNRNNLCRKWCGYRLDCDLDGMCPWVIP